MLSLEPEPHRSQRSQPPIPVQHATLGTSRSRAAAKRLCYFFFFLVICPLSHVCVSAGGRGRALVTPAMADFSDNCPRDCTCKWANGKREADCTRAGFTAIPTNLVIWHYITVLSSARWFYVSAFVSEPRDSNSTHDSQLCTDSWEKCLQGCRIVELAKNIYEPLSHSGKFMFAFLDGLNNVDTTKTLTFVTCKLGRNQCICAPMRVYDIHKTKFIYYIMVTK
jgi:hypothetical protein